MEVEEGGSSHVDDTALFALMATPQGRDGERKKDTETVSMETQKAGES